MSQSVTRRCLQNVDRIHEKIFLSDILILSRCSTSMVQSTNLACAMTLEKLSLRILIKDVMRRILVIQTKMSFP